MQQLSLTIARSSPHACVLTGELTLMSYLRPCSFACNHCIKRHVQGADLGPETDSCSACCRHICCNYAAGHTQHAKGNTKGCGCQASISNRTGRQSAQGAATEVQWRCQCRYTCCKGAGVPHCHVHRWRRSCLHSYPCSWLVALGGNPSPSICSGRLLPVRIVSTTASLRCLQSYVNQAMHCISMEQLSGNGLQVSLHALQEVQSLALQASL